MKTGVVAIMLVLGFLLGLFANSLGTAEQPLFVFGQEKATERLSPSDHVKQSQIHVFKDRIVIDIDNPEWAVLTNTNSMDPVLDSGANALQIKPGNESDIHEGDIISYYSQAFNTVVIHRVIKTGYDDEGWYAVTKGDNNNTQDPDKVRFSQVRKLLIGIIY